MAGFLDNLSGTNQVSSIVDVIYIGYFSRAADGPGYLYWSSTYGAQTTAPLNNSSAVAATNIANSFALQNEAKAQYAFLASPPPQINANDPVQVAAVNTLIETVYQNLFNRAADAPGLAYWTTQILTQQVAVGTAIYAIADGAQTSDQAILTQKIAAAQDFTQVTYGANLGVSLPLSASFVTAAKNSVASVVDATTEAASVTASAAYAAGTNIGQNVNLTTGPDNVTGANFFGSLTPFLTNGVGPTVQSTDVLTGSTPPAGQTANNTVTVSDDFATANDQFPVGLTLNNIQNVVLNTAGTAGGAGLFDTSVFPGVLTTTINSSGFGLDNVRVGQTTALTVNHENVGAGAATGVQTYGGSTVTVTDNAGVGSLTTIGSTTVANANPTGAIVVNAVSSTTTVFGGTTVLVNQSGIGGGITIGTAGFSVSPAEPTGAVTVIAPATSTVAAGNAVTILGGASDTVTTGGGVVTIGAQVGQTVFTVTGNSTITDNAAVALASNYVTGATTGVPPAGVVAATAVPGAFLSAAFSEVAVTVLGGQAVSVTTNAGGVVVGQTAALAFNGTVLTPGLLPSGDVTITDTSDTSASIILKAPAASNPFGLGILAATPVSVYGGANVSVTDSGSAVTVGDFLGANVVAPTGAITVTDTAQVVRDGIVNLDDNWVSVFGGTTVNVTTNAGDVQVGTGVAGVVGTEPTGNITVADTAFDAVLIFGGANVTASGTNSTITIGAGNKTTNPTGNVTATESGLFTGTGQNGPTLVTVAGGANITVNTTGGGATVGTKATPVTGQVTITDTQVGANADAFTVIGGSSSSATSVSIATTATSGAITVGLAGLAVLNSAGTALANPAAYANGTVTIVNESLAGTNAAGAANVFGTGAVSVNTNGATTVSIAGGGSATVVDEQTTPATGGANAGSAIGTSTLATVTLDGVGGAAASTVTSGVLANLSVLDSSKASPTAVTVNSPLALNLTLGNDAAGTTITDAKAPSITIASSGTASNTFALSAAAATALTFTNTAAVTLLATAASNDAAVKTITISGSGAVSLPDFTAGTTADGVLATIAGGSATGAIKVGGINPFLTAFTGGSGNDSVTITFNPNPPAGSTVQNITGGGGSNTIVANYVAVAGDVALHSANQISGFQVFGLGPLANSTIGPFNALPPSPVNPYDAGGFASLTVGATAGPVTFSNIGGGTTSLAITASQGGANTIGYLLNDPGKNLDSLALTVGSDTTTLTTAITTTVNIASDTITGGKASVGVVNSISIASLDPSTVIGTNMITINDSIVNLNGLPLAGTNVISISGDFAAKIAYNLIGAPTASAVGGISSTDTAAVDVTGVHELAAGVAITGGAGKITAFGASQLPGTLNTVAVDLFTTGAGGGNYTVGAGGGWNAALNAHKGGNDSGSETMNLTASTAVSDTLKVGPSISAINNGSGAGGVTGFQAIASAKAADVIALTGIIAPPAATSGYSVMANAAANNTSPAGFQNAQAFIGKNPGFFTPAVVGPPAVPATGDLTLYDPSGALVNLTFASSNGVITFGAVSGHNINEFNPTQLLGAAEGIVSEEALLTGQDQVAVFAAAFAGLPANTYIVASDMFNNAVGAGNGVFLNAADKGHIFGASSIELNGVTGITGFGATAALNVVELTGATQVLPTGLGVAGLTLANGGAGNLGTVAGVASDDTGFSEDTLGLVGGTAASTNTYNNLGSFAQIDVTKADVGPAQQGNLVIGAQAGTQGSDSFELNFLPAAGTATLNSLTVTSDDLVTVVTGPAGALDTIGTFTDTNTTVASLVVSGAGNLAITNPISDAALTSIDAHLDTGTLTITVAEKVSIVGALGGDTIVAAGANDTIAVGSSSNAIAGAVSITANGSGDTITLTHELAGGLNFVSAASGGDTITVDLGTNDLGGTFTGVPPALPFVTSLGAGDTINLHSGVETFVAAGAPLAVNFAVNDFAWVGSGTTVNLGTTANPWGGTAAVGAVGDAATLIVIGDTTGATSGNSPAITVVNGFVPHGPGVSGLTLEFAANAGTPLITLASAPPAWFWAGSAAPGALGGAAFAQVNMAGATSLANALDIAAGAAVQIDSLGALGAATHSSVANGVVNLGAAPVFAKVGLLDWFQFGGNTYIVESINSGAAPAAHAALGTGDVVVELTGLVNVATDAHLHFI